MTEHVFESKTMQSGDGTMRVVISTAARDRVGDVVEIDGWELDNYRRNPVVLWSHDVNSLPVGRSLEIAVEGRKLVSRIQWAPTADGQALKKLYEQGFLSAFSVGFRPLAWEPVKGGRGVRYTRAELLEYSAVAVPANSEALVVGRDTNLFTRKGLRRLFLGEDVGEPVLEALPEFERVREATVVAAAAAERVRRLQQRRAGAGEVLRAIRLAIRTMECHRDALSGLVAAGRTWQARKQLDMLRELVA